MTTAIWIALVALSVFFIYVLSKDILKHKKVLENVSTVKTAIIGFVVNFFDVLGIGAFAPQTALLKFTKQTEDRVLPGTLNVANTIPVLIQALIFIQIVEVESITLLTMLLSAATGAVLGAGIVSRLAVKKIQWINRKAAVFMAIPGAIAVLIAAFVVKSLPLDTLRWVVIVVIIYTAVIMFRSARSQDSTSTPVKNQLKAHLK